MSIALNFSPAEIPNAIATFKAVIIDNPLPSILLFGSYILYYVYLFINHKAADSEIYEIDLLSAGISSFMIGLLLLGVSEESKTLSLSSFNFSSGTSVYALMLMGYALLLILFAFVKILPRVVVILLGNSELDFFINFMAIMLTQQGVAITGTLMVLVAVPLIILLIIQRVRRAL